MPTTQPAVRPRKVLNFSWMIPATLVVLLAAGAVGSLIGGLPSADMMGADGMARTVVVR